MLSRVHLSQSKSSPPALSFTFGRLIYSIYCVTLSSDTDAFQNPCLFLLANILSSSLKETPMSDCSEDSRSDRRSSLKTADQKDAVCSGEAEWKQPMPDCGL